MKFSIVSSLFVQARLHFMNSSSAPYLFATCSNFIRFISCHSRSSSSFSFWAMSSQIWAHIFVTFPYFYHIAFIQAISCCYKMGLAQKLGEFSDQTELGEFSDQTESVKGNNILYPSFLSSSFSSYLQDACSIINQFYPSSFYLALELSSSSSLIAGLYSVVMK